MVYINLVKISLALVNCAQYDPPQSRKPRGRGLRVTVGGMMNCTADKIRRITHCLRMLFLCMENKVLFIGDMLHTFVISCYLTTKNI